VIYNSRPFHTFLKYQLLADHAHVYQAVFNNSATDWRISILITSRIDVPLIPGASTVSVEENFDVFLPLQTTPTNQGRLLRLELVAPTFHSPRPFWPRVSCVLLFHLERFIISSENFS
jgi:hypothetical protein